VETTGLSAQRNDIIQIGALVEIDGEVVEEINLRCQPFDWDAVEPEALAISGATIEKLRSYCEPSETYQKFTKILGKYVNKYDPKDKFQPAGYNVDFDLRFLSAFMKKNNDNYFGSYTTWQGIDPLPLLRILKYRGDIALPRLNLAAVCTHFEIEHQAHDALSDIKATRELMQLLLTRYFK
jgi:DNA polymerase-3 subunit epsilon